MKNETIQIDGKFYQQRKVVMLPTEKAENCIIKDMRGALSFWHNRYFTQEYLKQDGRTSQHLYIISDGEIKEGDWLINEVNDIKQSIGGSMGNIDFYGKTKKVVATTDESLKVVSMEHFGTIPRPSDEFLQAYCKANGKIDEVLVEYNPVRSFKEIADDCIQVCSREGANCDCDKIWKKQPLYPQLKVSPDNTITIKKLEKERDVREVAYQSWMNSDKTHAGFLIWAKNNL